MRSDPHHKNMGWREASSMFTVVTSVSDHLSTGPTGVTAQSNDRVSLAISPVPMIRADVALFFAVRRWMFFLERRADEDDFKLDRPILGISLVLLSKGRRGGHPVRPGN